MRQAVITCATEGGLYVPGRNPGHPIRIYPNRWVEDDILVAYRLRHGEPAPKKRERLSRKEFRHVRRAAAQNRKDGLV